ncbi:MAG: hypothetical protein K0Q73_8812, partial [Paenibacillus sp.]|nr:hypothetical protein [Paenibacillus sp.]
KLISLIKAGKLEATERLNEVTLGRGTSGTASDRV